MRKVIGVGETILDIIFKENQPHRAVPGGSVFNGFVSLSRLGLPLAFISELGDDRVGKIIRTFMEENNLTTEYVNCFPIGKSPLSLAFLDEEHNAQYTFYKDYPSQRLDMDFPEINEDDLLIFGSYYALNPVLRPRIVELLQYAKERKAILYYDPNFRKAHMHEAISLMPTVLENLELADIVRGSDEDFSNLFGHMPITKVYNDHIRYYCPNFIATHGAEGVNLFTKETHKHFDVDRIQPVSTIGAGDNFNAGILYGLLKYGIGHAALTTMIEETWDKIIRCGIDLASEVCQSYDNYISKEFASQYLQ
ncbi:carbohydrate kinase [Parabacteroides sp. PF5-9]|uniref:carbohydrate kinase family protein n=1 Tax=Parabacteroides sp. PF5-9 TaxID=1742404 RepID=UPI00247527C6|nr:carbohydrate kinase [Parabacteroides sp. PF5-9]MDH6356863.1 fructokinase [Parabacteroides sp. PF5-9]